MFLTSHRRDHHLASAVLFDAPETLSDVFLRQPCEHLAGGQSLFFEGDEARHVFEVTEGSLRVFRIIADGRRVITGFAHQGDVVGVSLRSAYPYSAEAICETRVRRLSRRSFDAVTQENEVLRDQVFARLCDEMAAAQDQMVLLSSKTAEERLCTFLLKHMKRTLATQALQPVLDIPMTRLDMGDYLGLTIETVSRTISKLIARGVISPVGRHAIRVNNPSLLAQMAGDGDECEDQRRLVAGGRRH